jgi:ubiquinol-cytochrome c reductase cytochrome b subunit
VVDVFALGYLGAMPAEGIYLFLARITTTYYFLHFIVILPALGFFEKTDPLPASISEPVLTGGFSVAAARSDKIINAKK